MKVKSPIGILSALLFWIVSPASAPSTMASGPADITSVGCANDTWAATSTINAPIGRTQHPAVWTGREMIVWGGAGERGSDNSGGRYDPAMDTWIATSLKNAPIPRSRHTAVWTGSEMIIWGGFGVHPFNSGGRYDPVTDTWMAISTEGAPSPRFGHSAVWTGKEMLVWGGVNSFDPSDVLNSGGRYNPATDTWAAISTEGAPSARSYYTAVWTGTEMLVWGGYTGRDVYFLNSGGRYNPFTDTWAAINTDGAPSARSGHTAVWTGTEMLVWGGAGREGLYNSGGRYDLDMDTWAPTSLEDAPSVRIGHAAVWTGSQMIVWGGNFPSTNTGSRYDPGTNTWVATSTDGAPDEWWYHTAVWTGVEMIVWGGGATPLNTGSRYCMSAGSDSPPLQ